MPELLDLDELLKDCETMPLSQKRHGVRNPPGATNLKADDLPPTKTLLEARDAHCRWPYDGLMVCGRAKKRGTYCEAHAAKAYQPPTKAKSLKARALSGTDYVSDRVFDGIRPIPKDRADAMRAAYKDRR